MKLRSLLTKRGRGQMLSRKRAVNRFFSGGSNYSKSTSQDGCANGCAIIILSFFWKIFIWVIKISFFPITLIYYGYIKKRVKTKHRTILKIVALFVWSFYNFIIIEDYIFSADDFKFDEGDAFVLFTFLVPQIYMMVNIYLYFKNGDYKKKNPLFEKKESIIAQTKPVRRRSITQSVKDRVWNRDGGKCVICGTNENLEFDHIIPFSKGGANTYRNIQLLCESCNREKSDKIG